MIKRSTKGFTQPFFSKKSRVGFTLIEILIVVAIIGVLASVVLIGLGPTVTRGRDSRRVQDLKQIQNGLELYFQKKGVYPDNLYTDLAGSGLVPKVPTDPQNNNYLYEVNTSKNMYVLKASLENKNVDVSPLKDGLAAVPALPTGETYSGDTITCTQTSGDYCVSL